MAQPNWNPESANTQRAQIANYLMAGNHITPLEALNKFGSLRLSAVIFDLKKQGYKINSQKVKTESGKFVADYWIDEADSI